jgi:cytochrome c peroxidase
LWVRSLNEILVGHKVKSQITYKYAYYVPPLFSEPGWNTRKASKNGSDDFQANRANDNSYRTAPLRGLFSHMKGGFYHDGRFATLLDVVNHYNGLRTWA